MHKHYLYKGNCYKVIAESSHKDVAQDRWIETISYMSLTGDTANGVVFSRELKDFHDKFIPTTVITKDTPEVEKVTQLYSLAIAPDVNDPTAGLREMAGSNKICGIVIKQNGDLLCNLGTDLTWGDALMMKEVMGDVIKNVKAQNGFK